ncbi:hypothetical protein Mro03_64020 [Microbispora rosea subsp. rosea]|nr:hypothetical protein Mro03_64020 [Microbispora rosea subsp. rosea]
MLLSAAQPDGRGAHMAGRPQEAGGSAVSAAAVAGVDPGCPRGVDRVDRCDAPEGGAKAIASRGDTSTEEELLDQAALEQAAVKRTAMEQAAMELGAD